MSAINYIAKFSLVTDKNLTYNDWLTNAFNKQRNCKPRSDSQELLITVPLIPVHHLSFSLLAPLWDLGIISTIHGYP